MEVQVNLKLFATLRRLVQAQAENYSIQPGTTVGELIAKLGLPEKQVKLICDIDDDVPEILYGDEGHIRQVLINLLGNATKFTHQGEVKLAISLLSESNDEYVVRYEVSDTGPGIPEEVQAKIFDSFVQADGSTTRKFGGLGLGLAISYAIVREHNGSLHFESDLGIGTRAWMCLPMLQ